MNELRFRKGDWNRDGRFDTQDLLAALKTGEFEREIAMPSGFGQLAANGQRWVDRALAERAAGVDPDRFDSGTVSNIAQAGGVAADSAAAADLLFGDEFGGADLGVGVGRSPLDELEHAGEGSKGLVPDPMTGLVRDAAEDKGAGDRRPLDVNLTPSMNLRDHLSGLASDEGKTAEPKPPYRPRHTGDVAR